jgi:hypothetical protein
MANGATDVSDRFAALERRQRRASRGLMLLGIVVLVQALVIAYLVVPFGGPAKHLLTVQAGKVEVVDRTGTARAEFTAESGQTLFKMSDAKERTRVLLRENEAGFVTMEFFEPNSNEKTMTLYTDTRRSFLKLHDPKTGRHLNLQAATEGMGLFESAERGHAQP